MGEKINQHNLSEFVIYQQGYGFGEKIFNAHISGEVPMKNIRKLFKRNFEGRISAYESFLGLNMI